MQHRLLCFIPPILRPVRTSTPLAGTFLVGASSLLSRNTDYTMRALVAIALSSLLGICPPLTAAAEDSGTRGNPLIIVSSGIEGGDYWGAAARLQAVASGSGFAVTLSDRAVGYRPGSLPGDGSGHARHLVVWIPAT